MNSPLRCAQPISARDVAALVDGSVVGDPEREVRFFAAIGDAAQGTLCFLSETNVDPGSPLLETVGVVILVPRGSTEGRNTEPASTLIEVAEPRASFIRAIRRFAELPGSTAAANPSTPISPLARLGKGVTLGAGVSIAPDSEIGDDCVLSDGVRILAGVVLHQGVEIQPNTVVGAAGQSFVRDDDGRMLEMPHAGTVVVDRGCRIGANATIVRGTLRDTVIGEFSSVGNNANIGHNVVIGPRSFVGPGALLNGSSRLGSDVWIAPGAVVCGVEVGDGARVGYGAVVTRPVAAGAQVNGFPARPTGRADG